ncbi:nucleotide sugar dehydrogenase, partial [Capsaspora owczarzaki ATCC 30864]
MSAYANKTVAVIGTGYVGLPMCLMLARAGWKVVGVDINPAVVQGIMEGRLHIREPVLQELFDTPVVRKNFTAQTTPPQADIFVVAVPTPLTHGATTADLTLVAKATESIVPVLRKGNLVVLESTVSPRCCRDVMTPILEKSGLKVHEDFYISHCPERILPGTGMLDEIENNDRIVGAANKTAQDLSVE